MEEEEEGRQSTNEVVTSLTYIVSALNASRHLAHDQWAMVDVGNEIGSIILVDVSRQN